MERTALNIKKLIEKKYYADSETVTQKLDLLMLDSRITDEEYNDLTMLIEHIYNPDPLEPETGKVVTGAEPETPTEPTTEVI